ncbi:hypothetical protein D3C80_1682390 [compost metagenome]
MGGDAFLIVIGLAAQILVEQQIALVCAIGQIIDGHDVAHMGTHQPLPAGVEGIVVDHQPVGAPVGQDGLALRRVLFPATSQPACMRE